MAETSTEASIQRNVLVIRLSFGAKIGQQNSSKETVPAVSRNRSSKEGSVATVYNCRLVCEQNKGAKCTLRTCVEFATRSSPDRNFIFYG